MFEKSSFNTKYQSKINMPKYLTKREVAEMLSVSPGTVENWVYGEKVSFKRFWLKNAKKPLIRFSESDILEMKENIESVDQRKKL